ncbi:MAG: O-antigen ligase family protein [Bdellovibrionota bacterium]
MSEIEFKQNSPTSLSNAGILEAEAISAKSIQEISKVDKKLIKIFTALLSAFCFLIPVSFGGVHEITYYSFYSLGFLATGLFLLNLQNKKSLPNFSLDKKTFLAFIAAFPAWAIFQQAIFYFNTDPHSVLNSTSKFANNFFAVPLLSQVFFISLCILIFLVLENKRKPNIWLVNLLISSGFLVSLIALSHWFYDNGRLLWIFEPEYVFTSNRARWPFVNSNHLGHFLLIPAFLCIAKFINIFTESKTDNPAELKPASKLKKFSRLATSRGQSRLIQLIFSFVALLSMVLAIFGSLSRGAIFGFSIGVLILSLSSILMRDKKLKLIKKPEVKLQDLKQKQRRKRHGKINPNEIIDKYLNKFSIAVPYIISFVGILLFIVFMSGEGAERLEGRLEHTLLHTKDNIRWEMYKDSLEILATHPFGIGLGNWENIYPTVANQRLSGVNPVYLHSDVLQLIIELGWPALILLFCGFFTFCFTFIKQCLRKRSNPLFRANFAGIFALCIASLLDFPFRIPAIMLIFSLGLSLFVHLVDRSLES